MKSPLFVCVVVLCGCGDKGGAGDPVVVNAVPEHTQCEERRGACEALVQSTVNACDDRADRAALSKCIGEGVRCFNSADVDFQACMQGEQDCREKGTPELRVCFRTCRNDYLIAQSGCSDTQTNEYSACDNSRDECIAPAEETLTACNASAQVAFLDCSGTARGIMTSCQHGCASEECFTACMSENDTALVLCNTNQEQARRVCQDAYDDADRACSTAQQNCSNQAQQNYLLCIEVGSNAQEDCDRTCDPDGAARCDRQCYTEYSMKGGGCFSEEWDCYARESNEGSSACEDAARVKLDQCFEEQDVCEAQASAETEQE